jgi:hypothetical protein
MVSACDAKVHVSCPDVARFDRYTVASFGDAVAELVSKKDTVTKKEFDFLEKALGLVFCSDALIFDDYCRGVARFPETIFWDWMHCLEASGGIAQYQLNQIVLHLKRSGISLAEIDAFCSKVSMAGNKLSNTFFSDRVVEGPNSHIKAFGSEMLAAIPVFGLFCDAVLKPIGVLRSHVRCFDTLREITTMISKGDSTVQETAKIAELLREHHVTYMELYPRCVKPKLHYLKHAVECIAKFRCNLNCFSPERKHKEAKAVAAFCFKEVSHVRFRTRDRDRPCFHLVCLT